MGSESETFHQNTITLRIADALPETDDGLSDSHAMAGALNHHLGLCTPCDFMGRFGSCRNGAACKFCHLCGPSERRLFKKNKQKCVRALKPWDGATMPGTSCACCQ